MWFAPTHWSKNTRDRLLDAGRSYRARIASAAVRCLVVGAFPMPDVECVEVHHDVANIASGRIPERLGFSFVEERADEPVAPAEVGVERVWRRNRQDWSAATTDD